ncbi:TonB-dependent receptor [Bacteroides sp.]|uniref:SusC/RagA family TonB-linked outer membrane protein n=1 Tax=Bacteroides sp. TaxID=29523 RepID=UPI002A8081D9|nr:TonB-dependent receptor [Bacteroides sp.]
MRNNVLKKVMCILWMLILAVVSTTASAQGKKVTGTVSDTNGPLIGVNVMVKGTNTGTITNVDGNFSLEVPQNAVLIFKYVGYNPIEKVVGNNSILNIQMTEDSQQLDEVVVVGYGIQRKSDLTGSVTSVKAEELNTFPSSNVGDMLRGKAAGINVTATSGRPGSSPDILIRGKRSLTGGNEPLYVIDGVPVDGEGFANLNNADIKSLEVLKDAAAQAIYGARAANGVILITTKRGEKGKVQIDFNTYLGTQFLMKNFDFYSGEEFYQLRKEAVRTEMGRMPENAHEVLADEIMEKAYENKKFTDWENLMLNPALVQKYDLSIRGGGEKMKIAASLGFFKQDGMAPNSNYSRGNFTLNVDYDIYKWLSVGSNIAFARSKQTREDGNFKEYITRSPLGQPFNEDGSYTEYINSSLDVNPLYRAQNANHEIMINNLKMNVFMDLKPFKGFNYRLNTSFYNIQKEDGQYKNKAYPGGGASGTLSNGNKEHWLIENIINYAVPIKNQKHHLDLTLVQSWDNETQKNMEYSANNVPVDFDWNMLPDGDVTGIGRKYEERTLLSFMARAQYGLMDKYLLTAAWRRDGSSVFGPSNKWGDFLSLAIAWRIKEESFLKNVNWLSNLKLRASYGQVGNQAIQPYKTLGATQGLGTEFGNVLETGYLPTKELSNPNLKWETTGSVNLAVDFGLFENRLSGTVEYYNTTTTDLLVARTINNSLGYSTMYDNLGKTRTQGWEMSLNADVFRQKDFKWSVGVNFTKSKNEIVKVNGKVDSNGKPLDDVNNKWFIGQPIDVYYDYQFDGIYQYEDFDKITAPDGTVKYELKKTYDTDGDGIPDKALSRTDNVEPGFIKVKDINNDGIINSDDRVVIKKDPDYVASISSNLYFKGFDLYLDFYTVQGATLQNEYFAGESLQGKLNAIKVDYWTPENPSNVAPRPRFQSQPIYNSTRSYQDASYFRLRTISLGYTFPRHLTEKININNLKIYCTGTNLLTFTKFKSYSPELTPGSYPESKQVIFGLNVSF